MKLIIKVHGAVPKTSWDCFGCHKLLPFARQLLTWLQTIRQMKSATQIGTRCIQSKVYFEGSKGTTLSWYNTKLCLLKCVVLPTYFKRQNFYFEGVCFPSLVCKFFLWRVSGLSLRDKVRSSVIWEGLRIELLLLKVVRTFDQDTCEVFWTSRWDEAPRQCNDTLEIMYLTWLGNASVSPEELGESAGEKYIWASLLRLLALPPGLW